MFNNKIDDYYKELIRRYNYLLDNSIYILAPYVHKENNKELKDRLDLWEKDNFKHSLYEPLIYFKGLEDKDLLLIEKLLFEEIPLEKTKYYKKLEKLKNNKNYLKKVKHGIKLSKEIKLDINKLLLEIENNILRQSGDLGNKWLKLKVLEIYFNLNQNNNRKKNDLYQYISMRSKYDIGVTNNRFINYFANKNINKKIRKWW